MLLLHLSEGSVAAAVSPRLQPELVVCRLVVFANVCANCFCYHSSL